MSSRLSKKEGNLHKLMTKAPLLLIQTTTYAPGTTYAHLPPFPTSVWLRAPTLWGPILFISCIKTPLYDLYFYQRLTPSVSVLGIYWSFILHMHPSDAQDCKLLKELCLLWSPAHRVGSWWAGDIYWEWQYVDFPGGPVAKTLSSQCRGPKFHPWSGN